jgi:hypothetical protein
VKRFTQDEWYNNPDAPFYDLLHTVHLYLDPEVQPDDELFEMARQHPEVEWVARFKEAHRVALLAPDKLPDGALFRAVFYDDEDDVSYLRRLWRDLYPREQVPGGDDGFREDLRKLVHGELDRVPSAVTYYSSRPLPMDPDELKTLGREVWQRFYPEEPLPE